MKKLIVIPGVIFNQNYEIDEEGNVWSYTYKEPRILHSHPTKKGYYRISLQTSEGQKTFQVHRLVLMTFNPVENMDKLEVNHIDGDKSNNHLLNLEWCTGVMNMRHCMEMGLRKNTPRGEQVYGNKLKEEQVLEICERLIHKQESLQEIANDYGVTKHAIFDIKRKRTWKWLTTDYDFN